MSSAPVRRDMRYRNFWNGRLAGQERDDVSRKNELCAPEGAELLG